MRILELHILICKATACYASRQDIARKLAPGRGISFTVNRVPFGGGGVPSTRAPMSSMFSPTPMSAGVRSVHQMRVETPPDFETRLFVAGPRLPPYTR